MDFQQRLDKAIQRGRRTGVARAQAEAQQALSEKELQKLHSQYRLELSEQIERCLRQLCDRFPGFRAETLMGESGWGTAISRDNIRMHPGGSRENLFSRLELAVRPIGQFHVLELAGKATVGNRELFNRTHYQPVGEVDLESFQGLIDAWALEFAEVYAARS